METLSPRAYSDPYFGRLTRCGSRRRTGYPWGLLNDMTRMVNRNPYVSNSAVRGCGLAPRPGGGPSPIPLPPRGYTPSPPTGMPPTVRSTTTHVPASEASDRPCIERVSVPRSLPRQRSPTLTRHTHSVPHSVPHRDPYPLTPYASPPFTQSIHCAYHRTITMNCVNNVNHIHFKLFENLKLLFSK